LRADPEDVFVVSSSKGFVHITCRNCGWHCAYLPGDTELRERAKAAALQHLADEKDGSETEVESYRR